MMRTSVFKALTVLVLAATCALAMADTPSRVGRISLAQGQVTVGGEPGEETSQALVNWPITSRNQISTGRDSRTEFRIGSTAVRLDGDSALDVTELDDENLRIHLHYGSVSIRLLSPEAARGFELTTSQGVISMSEAGRMRVDAERRPSTTVVNVFSGVALVDGGGSRLTVRAGKRAEVGVEDIRTGLAVRDAFDDWAALRDQRDDRSLVAMRYVTDDMTGYEELDQYGSWRDDNEYGPLWAPRVLPAGWAPYRDGRWTFVQPWGWTWVDNAPWGYAPSHYGRWVMVNQRWCWAPGRNIIRAVWAPALVGWVGGNNWSVTFNSGGTSRHAPAQGWYPLSPREAFVPHYRMREDHLRFVNRHARDERRDGRRHDNDGRGRDGLTVVPQDHFNRRGPVVVPGAPRAIVSATSILNAPTAVPQAPAGYVRNDRNGDGRPDNRYDRSDRNDRNGDGRPDYRGERGQRDGQSSITTPTRVITLPSQPQQPGRRDGRDDNDDRRGRPAPAPAPAPVIVQQPAPAPMPAQEVGRPVRDERFTRDRGGRGDRDQQRMVEVNEPVRQAPPVARPMPQPERFVPPPMQQQAPIQVSRPQPQPQPERAAPQPQPQTPAAARNNASNDANREAKRQAREDANDRR